MKALYPSRECRKSGISDKHWFCNVFKNPNNVTKSIEVYSLEVCLSPVIWRGDIYPCTQHTDTIQIPSQMSRKRLGLCEETIPYGQKVHRLFGRTSFTSTTVWGKVKALGIWSIWITERLFNNDEANYILYLYPLLLIWGKSEKKKKSQPRALFGPDLASHAEWAVWFPYGVVCSKIPSVVTMGHKIFLSGSLVKYTRTDGRII